MSESEPLTLREVYVRVNKIDTEIRPKVIERDRLIRFAEEHFYNKLKNL